jgi:hypothetical protein
VPIAYPVLPLPFPSFEDDSSTYFGDSKTLRTPAHRMMVIKFVREKFANAGFLRIYDAASDGWKDKDFHKCCDKKGWTLTIVETTKGFIFGGFTTAEWETPSWYNSDISKPSPHSFLFSVNEGTKYPIAGGDRGAIECFKGWCAMFGTSGSCDLVIKSQANTSISFCNANMPSFKLPAAEGSLNASMNGGENVFLLKKFEVYMVFVRNNISIINIGIMKGPSKYDRVRYLRISY